MALYPPELPPSNRTDATIAAVNHARDHNLTATALAALVEVLGSDPAGTYADLTTRLLGIATGQDQAAIDAFDEAYAAVQALVVTDLGTSDGQTSALVATQASQTWAALLARLVPRWRTGVTYAVGDVVVFATGDVKVATAAHTSSGGTPDTTKWGDPPAIVATTTKAARDRARDRRITVRQRPALPSKYAVPGSLNLGFDLPVFYDGAKHTTPFDPLSLAPTPAATRFVDSVNGSPGTIAGTEGAPHQSIQAAIQQASEGTEIVLLNKGITYRSQGPGATAITKSLRFTARYPKESFVANADVLTWTAHPTIPKVWQATRSNVFRVVDLAVDPLGYIYTAAASEAAVGATPGSWYANGSVINVRTVDGVQPTNDRILALLVANQFVFDATSRVADMSVVFNGLGILGGTTGLQLANPGSFELDFYGRNYIHAHSGGNGLTVSGARRVLSKGALIAGSELDGFNYHSSSSKPAPKFVEVGCEAHSSVSTSSPTQNASTSHDGSEGVRVGGSYHDTYGTPVADVNANTKTVNLSCDAWGSKAPSGIYNAAFSAQQSGAEMWVNGCRAWGTESDLYAVSGATLHADSTEYDTTGGPGTLDITNAR